MSVSHHAHLLCFLSLIDIAVKRHHALRRQEDEEYQQIENDGGNVDFFTALCMDGLFVFHVKRVPLSVL